MSNDPERDRLVKESMDADLDRVNDYSRKKDRLFLKTLKAIRKYDAKAKEAGDV
jgi:uncharacterized protein YutE (UPF0331/DUF86 family)